MTVHNFGIKTLHFGTKCNGIIPNSWGVNFFQFLLEFRSRAAHLFRIHPFGGVFQAPLGITLA